MQANQRVYRLAAVGRLVLTDCCSAMRDLPLSKRPERAILESQPPGIGGMSVQLVALNDQAVVQVDILDHCFFAWNKRTSSLTSLGPSCQSACAIGRTGSDQWDLV